MTQSKGHFELVPDINVINKIKFRHKQFYNLCEDELTIDTIYTIFEELKTENSNVISYIIFSIKRWTYNNFAFFIDCYINYLELGYKLKITITNGIFLFSFDKLFELCMKLENKILNTSSDYSTFIYFNKQLEKYSYNYIDGYNYMLSKEKNEYVCSFENDKYATLFYIGGFRFHNIDKNNYVIITTYTNVSTGDKLYYDCILLSTCPVNKNDFDILIEKLKIIKNDIITIKNNILNITIIIPWKKTQVEYFFQQIEKNNIIYSNMLLYNKNSFDYNLEEFKYIMQFYSKFHLIKSTNVNMNMSMGSLLTFSEHVVDLNFIDIF